MPAWTRSDYPLCMESGTPYRDMRVRCRRRTSDALEGRHEGESKAVATGAPTTRYARSGEYSIAYQVVGEGEIDLVYVPGLASHLELFWEEPAYSRFLHRLASFSRLILMDRLGTGRLGRLPPNRASTFE